MPKVGPRQIGGGMNVWEIEFESPVTAEEVLKFVDEQDHFGYHPAGYGGYLWMTGHGLVRTGENPTGTRWQYKCWLSCD